MRPIPALAMTAVVALSAGCGDSGDSGGSGGGDDRDPVAIRDFKYAPDVIEVKQGQTLEFTNEDTAKHTATSKKPGVFDSGDITTDQTKPVKFSKAGSFRLYCVYHPTMAAQVKVTK